jgi:hypothetical protein
VTNFFVTLKIVLRYKILAKSAVANPVQHNFKGDTLNIRAITIHKGADSEQDEV